MKLSPVFIECSPSRSRYVVDQSLLFYWIQSVVDLFDVRLLVESYRTILYFLPRICLKQNQYVSIEKYPYIYRLFQLVTLTLNCSFPIIYVNKYLQDYEKKPSLVFMKSIGSLFY